MNNKEFLIYNENAQKEWGGAFDIATPQETANAFDKIVIYKNKKITPKKNARC